MTGLGSLILLALHFFDAAFKASSATALRDSAHFLQIEMFIYRCLQCIINHWNYCAKAHSCSSVMMNPQSPGDHMIPWLYFEIISLGEQNCIYVFFFFFLSWVGFQIRGMGKCLQEIFYKLGCFFVLCSHQTPGWLKSSWTLGVLLSSKSMKILSRGLHFHLHTHFCY